MRTYTIKKGRSWSWRSFRDHTKIVHRRDFRKIKVEVEVLPTSVYPTHGDVDLLGD